MDELQIDPTGLGHVLFPTALAHSKGKEIPQFAQ